MSDCIMVGCDLHDRSMLLKWTVGKEPGKKLTFANTPERRRRMIELVHDKAEARGVERIVFAYEASCLGYTLHDELQEAGIECHVLAPTGMARSPKHVRRKTDEKDAEQILDLLRAHVLAGAALPGIWVPDDQTRQDRMILRRRLELGQRVGRLKTRITHLLKLHGVSRPEGVQRWGVADRCWMRELTAKEIGYGVMLALDSLLRELEFTEAELAIQDQNVQALAKGERYRAPAAELDDLTGVGLLTAMVFLTEMGRMSRFSNRRQVADYLGLAPASRETGQQADRKGHITKQGPGRVRKVLCQAVWALLGHDEHETALHEKITAGKKERRKTATVALMRRLAIRMWHIAREAQKRCGCFEAAAVAARRACATVCPAPDCSYGVKDTTRLPEGAFLLDTSAVDEQASGKPLLL
jgi:transposase